MTITSPHNPTTSSKKSLKLGIRLQKIEQMVATDYSHIWDCCCDHGLLGAALLTRQNNGMASTIHFVDIVPELMSELDNKLQRFFSKNMLTRSKTASTQWQTHCLDVANLPLEQYPGKQLVIIAGVGGDLMIKFIEAINQQHKHLNIDYLLCPVHHQFPLRAKLIKLDFSLKDEVLVAENRRFYEILLVSSISDPYRKISPIGNKIWQSITDKNFKETSDDNARIADNYLKKTLNHYQRMQQGAQKGKSNNVQYIIDAYRKLLTSS